MICLSEIRGNLNLEISDDLLIAAVFDMSRAFDFEFTELVQCIQKLNGVVVDSPTRKALRKKYYYGDNYTKEVPFDIPYCRYDEAVTEQVLSDFVQRMSTYDKDDIIKSLTKKIQDICDGVESDDNVDTWLAHYDKRRANKKYSFVVCKLNQDAFSACGYDENVLTDFIQRTYNGLENYRYLALVVEGEIFNKSGTCLTWNLLYKACIYAENFVQYEGQFLPFVKEDKIKELSDFLSKRKIAEAESLATNFYSKISTGYQYEDCYVSDTQDCKILILRKIEYDESNVPCPSCNTTIQSSNSCISMFVQSWECRNPACPDRSKSGRGRRFDEYGVYRYFKAVKNNATDGIDNELYQAFRRDIFPHEEDWLRFLIKEYSYTSEKIYLYNCDVEDTCGRVAVSYGLQTLMPPSNSVSVYAELPLVELLTNVLRNGCKYRVKDELLKSDIEIINDDSTRFVRTLKAGQIGAVFSSPPYYNAREYSQWSMLVAYLVDMLISCKTIYNAITDGAYYLYNIGDVVSEDNVYVTSQMSKRRLPLGFMSAMIFEIAGYTLTGNILWDKGEVQSKRASTVNLISGYVKCVNCYEHTLVFRKGVFIKESNSVVLIPPVKKINSKGENTYGHTAPYPIELVELIRPYLMSNLYVLDPFLGSGTTLKWCALNGVKGVGVELNKTYYELCKENITVPTTDITDEW